MTEPTERGDTPTLWESHMIKWFLDGLLLHISAATKKSCVGYEDARLTELIQHAKHAERQITAEKTRKSDNREKQAHSAHLTMVKTVTNLAENEHDRHVIGEGLASTDEEEIMARGAAADRAEDVLGWEEMSATYATRRVTGLPTVPREKMVPGMPTPIRSLTEPRGRRGPVEREGAIFQRQQTRESFIPNYAPLEAPLSSLIDGKNLSSHDKVMWTPEADQAFIDLRLALQSSPTLGLPHPTKPFTQAVDERDGCMTSVLLQTHGKLRPVAYFSAKLDPVTVGHPRCLRAVAAAEKTLLASRDIVGLRDLMM
ncbi:hypothetical protein L3Q82_011443, partial [Scortum barcoo]